MVVRSLGVLASLGILACVSSAHAYCRTHTDDPPASSCPETCPELGSPLEWHTPNLTYTFHVNGFPGIDDENLRRMVGKSFDTWGDVRCDGKSVGLDIKADKQTTAMTVGHERKGINKNVIVHFTREEWSAQSLSSKAFAITAVWFDDTDGEIVGADMMFNGGMDPFGECSDDGCLSGDPRTDLRNVATHEAGHFLGLSHSAVEDSTMWCDASPSEVSKRNLSPDDVEGLCDVYPPGLAFQALDGAQRNHSCAFLGGGSGHASWQAALALLLLWRRRQRAA